jgi:hypothetical protein
MIRAFSTDLIWDIKSKDHPTDRKAAAAGRETGWSIHLFAGAEKEAE